MKRTRILLADDHILVIEAIKNLLEPEFEVVATVSDGRSLVSKAVQLNPDVIVMDISMPLLNGLDAGRQLKATLPHVKFIYLTMNQDQDIIAEAFKIGATGFLVKHCAFSELRNAIRQCFLGRAYITPLVGKNTVPTYFKTPLRGENPIHLTPRQREVLQLLAEGRSMKEVAFALDVTTRTVAFHKYRMMEDLKLKTNAELIQYAVRRHIV
jgi:DNA-binding NarL/FixJ family response regulator